MFKIIKNIILIVVVLYIGAYVGKDNLNSAGTYTIKKAKTCWTWVTDTWNNTEVEETE